MHLCECTRTCTRGRKLSLTPAGNISVICGAWAARFSWVPVANLGGCGLWWPHIIWVPLPTFLILCHSHQFKRKIKWMISGHFRIGWNKVGGLLYKSVLIPEGKEVSVLYRCYRAKCPSIFPFSLLSCGFRLPGATWRGNSLLKECVILSRLSESRAQSHCQGQWA